MSDKALYDTIKNAVEQNPRFTPDQLATVVCRALEQHGDLLAVGLRSVFTDHELGVMGIEARTKGPVAGACWQEFGAACERAAGVA